jgi:hypothetical protein
VSVAVGGGAHDAAGEVAAAGVLAVGGDEHVSVGVGGEVCASPGVPESLKTGFLVEDQRKEGSVAGTEEVSR